MDAEEIECYSDEYDEGYPEKHHDIEQHLRTVLNDEGQLTRLTR